MQKSETLSEIGKALSKAQALIRPALKNSENPHLRSKYADLGSVWEAARDALAENGLSIIQMPDTDEPGHIALETMILHSSGEYISSRARVRLQKDDAQGAGSGLTYLRRYALSAAMGIVADDDDGHAASHGAPASASRPPQNAQRQQARPNTPPAPAAPAKLTKEKASDLHAQLSMMLKDTAHREMTHSDYAAQVIGREIKSLTDLTKQEAAQVYNAAKTAQAA